MLIFISLILGLSIFAQPIPTMKGPGFQGIGDTGAALNKLDQTDQFEGKDQNFKDEMKQLRRIKRQQQVDETQPRKDEGQGYLGNEKAPNEI